MTLTKSYMVIFAAVVLLAILLVSCGCRSRQEADDGNATSAPVESQPDAPLATDWPLSRAAAQALQEREARRLDIPRFSRLDLGGAVFIDLAFIPAGTFPMGSPTAFSNPQRMVKISKGFLISACEVTWQQFLQFVDEAEMYFMLKEHIKTMQKKHNDWPEYPADCSWLLAKKFCDNLSNAQGIRARLTTEAEWEYACRAGTMALFGESDSIDDTKANICYWPGPDGKEVYTKRKRIWVTPVGQYEANWWGVHDMMGNVTEWCLDAYSDLADISKLPPVDPVLYRKGSLFRVKRGGSFTNTCSVFYRDGDATSSPKGGIRMVVEIDDAIRARLAPLNK